MTIHKLTQPPPPELADALEAFERQFTYPLGPGRSFRISHGRDYSRFFRSMGNGASFIAERNGTILGAIGVAITELLRPDGNSTRVVYIGDLKVIPAARMGVTLLNLSSAVYQWVGGAQTGFGVVMDGTTATPDRYTGKFGIPLCRPLAELVILRISTAPNANTPSLDFVNTDEGMDCYRRLSRGRYASPGGNPGERSEMDPRWLATRGRCACGRLEDTRRAKQLFSDDGEEMLSAHLSCFAYVHVDDAANLIRAALPQASALGFPAIFVSIAGVDAPSVQSRLSECNIVVAGATVYGAGLDTGPAWNINTSEI